MGSILRFDQTTSDWVIFAPSRARRPHELRSRGAPAQLQPESHDNCPFCPGHESFAPQEIYAERPVNGALSDWRVRVIPNKFPALQVEEDPQRHEEPNGFRSLGGCGAHEVIIEAPDHDRLLCEQPVEQVERVLRAAQARCQDLMRDVRIQTVVVFKNHGEGAGTSLQHPHWQLIATPVVPRLLRLKYEVATVYFDQTGNCLYCDVVQRELEDGRRILAMNSEFVALMPFASHAPFETWILPRHHVSCFTQQPRADLRALAELLKSVLMQLHRGLDDPDYNLTIDTVARGDESKTYFLWHLRILPRLTTPGGFELGSGMSVNTVLPEEAAQFLRNAADRE